MQTSQFALRERCAPVTVFARRRRFLLGATATRESGVPPLAPVLPLMAFCGLLVALTAPPSFAQEACCLPNGTCLMKTGPECEFAQGGRPLGPGSVCCFCDTNSNGIDDACEPPGPGCQLDPTQTIDCAAFLATPLCPSTGSGDCVPTSVHVDAMNTITALECKCNECRVVAQPGNHPPRCEGDCLSGKPCIETWEPDGAGGYRLSCCCSGSDLIVDLTTGVTNTDPPASIAPGFFDDTWSAKTCDPPDPAAVPGPGVVVVDPDPAWSTLQPSQWISSNYNGLNGRYCYETCFCVNDGFQNPAQLTFSILADDTAEVYVHNALGVGLKLNPPPNYVTPTAFSGAVDLVTGENCIEVVVHNTGGPPTGFAMTGQLTAQNAECCPCPLNDPTPNDPCASLQKTDCLSDDETQTCLPTAVEIVEDTTVVPPVKYPSVTECACADSGTCGPFAIITDDVVGCPVPPCPEQNQECQPIVNGVPYGQPASLFVESLPIGAIVTCDCIAPCLTFTAVNFNPADDSYCCNDNNYPCTNHNPNTQPEETNRSLGLNGPPTNESFQTRYGQLIATNTRGTGTINAIWGTANYTVNFTRNAAAGETWCVAVDTYRQGAVTAWQDGRGHASACLSGVTGELLTVQTLKSGSSLSLPQVLQCFTKSPAFQSYYPFGASLTSTPQSSHAVISGIGTQAVSLKFQWHGAVRSEPLNVPPFGDGDSVGIRIGKGTNCIPSNHISTEVCTYPGHGGRTQSADGHFVTVECIPCLGQICPGGSDPCRPPVDVCDVEECPSGTDCPPDGFAAAETTCRPLTGVCDVEETCTGEGPACPPDGFAHAGTLCRPPRGPCDLPEYCDGLGSECPTDMGESITECIDFDGCCPEGCTPASDNDCTTPCPGGSDAECDDVLFCNGQETCDMESETCVPGANPCPPDLVCDEDADACVLAVPPIPTVSQWGLVILTLLLLIGAKIYFSRRQTATAS